MTSPRHALARNMKRLRVKAGLTQLDLAVRSGITLSTVARLESEKAESTTSLDTAARIANALSCSVDDLLADDTADAAA